MKTENEEVFAKILDEFEGINFDIGEYDLQHESRDGYDKLMNESDELKEKILDMVYKYMPKQFIRGE